MTKQNTNTIKQNYPYIILAFVVFVLDRISKYAALTYCIDRYEITSYFAFDVAFNRGISWGFFNSSNNLQFIVVSLIIATITLFVGQMAVVRFKQGSLILGETLVLAGSVSNLIDRIYYRGVIDFIELSYGLYVWPLFNIADACIVVGVGIMLMEYYRS